MAKRRSHEPHTSVRSWEIPISQHVGIESHPRVAQQPTPPVCEPGLIYTVQPGESLADIEQRLGVRQQDILAANPQLSGAEEVTAGLQICIPFVEPECASGIFVEVAPGDTLAGIAAEFDVTAEQLLEFNPQLANPEVLLPGFILCLPEVESSSRRARRVYRAQAQQRDESWRFGFTTVRSQA